MAQNRGRQKKLEQKRKKRDLAKKTNRAARLPSVAAELARRAVKYPFGPSYVSADYESPAAPALVTVVITRRAGDGRLIPLIALVDRTCLGVKSGFLSKPVTPEELNAQLDQVGRAHGGIKMVDLLLAQSIVFHALDYAQRLGFAPDPDYPLEVLGPRPATLLDTPFANAPKPFYAAGPHDDMVRIVQQLDAKLGTGNYDYSVGIGGGFEFLDDEAGDEDDGDGDDDGADIEGEGEVVDE